MSRRMLHEVACGRADLDQVRVPRILGDTEVIVALLLRCISPCAHSRGKIDVTFFVPLPKTWPGAHCQSRKLSCWLHHNTTHGTWKLAQIGLPLLQFVMTREMTKV
jgi:hypothetical protein